MYVLYGRSFDNHGALSKYYVTLCLWTLDSDLRAGLRVTLNMRNLYVKVGLSNHFRFWMQTQERQTD